MKERRLIYHKPTDSPDIKQDVQANNPDTKIDLTGFPDAAAMTVENIDGYLEKAESENTELDAHIAKLQAQLGDEAELDSSDQIAETAGLSFSKGGTFDHQEQLEDGDQDAEIIKQHLAMAKAVDAQVNKILDSIREKHDSSDMVTAKFEKADLEVKQEGEDGGGKYTFKIDDHNFGIKLERSDGNLQATLKVDPGQEWKVPLDDFGAFVKGLKKDAAERTPEKFMEAIGDKDFTDVEVNTEKNGATFSFLKQKIEVKNGAVWPKISLMFGKDGQVEGSTMKEAVKNMKQKLIEAQTKLETTKGGIKDSGVIVTKSQVKFTVAGVKRSFMKNKDFNKTTLEAMDSPKDIQKACYKRLLSIIFKGATGKAQRLGKVAASDTEFDASNKEMVRRLVDLGESVESLKGEPCNVPEGYLPTPKEVVEPPKAREQVQETKRPQQKLTEVPKDVPEVKKPKFEYNASHESSESLSQDISTDVILTLPPKYNLEADLINKVWKMLNAELTDGVEDLMADIREDGAPGPYMDKGFYAKKASIKLKELGLFAWAKAKINVLKAMPGSVPSKGSIEIKLDDQDKKGLTNIFLNLHGIGVEESEVVDKQEEAREASRDKRVEGDISKLVEGDHKLSAIGDLSDTVVKGAAATMLSEAIYTKLSKTYSGADEGKVIEAFEDISKEVIGTEDVSDLKKGTKIEIDEAKSAEYAAAFYKVAKEAVQVVDQKQIEATTSVEDLNTIDLNEDSSNMKTWEKIGDTDLEVKERFAALKKLVTEDGISLIKVKDAKIYIKKVGDDYSFINNPIKSGDKVTGSGPQITADTASLDSFSEFAEKEEKITNAISVISSLGNINISEIAMANRTSENIGEQIANIISTKFDEVPASPQLLYVSKVIAKQYDTAFYQSKEELHLYPKDIRAIAVAIKYPKDVVVEETPEIPVSDENATVAREQVIVEGVKSTSEINFDETYSEADKEVATIMIKDEESTIEQTKIKLAGLSKYAETDNYDVFVAEVKAQIKVREEWIVAFKASLARPKGEYTITRIGEGKSSDVGELGATGVITNAKIKTVFRIPMRDGTDELD